MNKNVRYTAEAVSLGHPDKTADFISSYLLDRFLEKDSYSKYAVEVMIKDNTVVLGGEVKSTHHFTNEELKSIVKDAIRSLGYDEKYAAIWGENAIEIDKIDVINLIGEQSSEINQGVENSQKREEVTGWGDQGIFMGYAANSFGHLRKDQGYAKRLASSLYEMAKNSKKYGLDIKTQVTIENDKLKTVIVAIPSLDKTYDEVKAIVNEVLDEKPEDLIINGTGSYKQHSSVADCGVTGRKLACDFYSSSCPIGGGSPWTKDASKADVSLNIYARKLAVEHLKDNDECFVYLSSCIGRSKLPSSYIETHKNGIITTREFKFDKTPEEIIELLDLRKPTFASMCKQSMKGFMLY